VTLYGCILFWSMVNGIDPALTKAVISVESNGNPFARGSVGEVGLMQIRPQFVPETKLQLSQSCTNVMRGTAILRELKFKCKHTLDRTYLTCYNLGRTKAAKLRFPKKWKYYTKVMAKMEQK
jgi:soluble lytic murein transglycosylase-like protein